MINIKNWIIALAIVASFGGSLMVTATPQIVAAKNCASSFLGFPAWYRGLTSGDCSISAPSGEDGLSKFIWHIALNVVEMALVAVGYISAFFILYGGFQFMTSQGKPDNAAKARSIILDAIIGLIISFAAVAVINFVVDGVLG